MSALEATTKPFKYPNPEDLEAVINKYFTDTPPNQWTVTGLALLVGSKQLLDNYQKRDGFTELVERAKLMVENSYELSLRDSGRTGDIFALKNFGWTDKQTLAGDAENPVKLDTTVNINLIRPKE